MGLSTADLDMRDRHPRFIAREDVPLAPSFKQDWIKRGEPLDLAALAEVLKQEQHAEDFGKAMKRAIEDEKVRRDRQEQFASGSVRDSRVGKGRYDLLPPDALRRVAKRFEDGALKYGEHNWCKGQPVSRYLDSAIRHAMNYLAGDRSEDNLSALAWNALAAMQTEEWVKAGKLPQSLADVKGQEL